MLLVGIKPRWGGFHSFLQPPGITPIDIHTYIYIMKNIISLKLQGILLEKPKKALTL